MPQFKVTDETRPAALTPFAEVSVFRIVQEAVNNACRHAEPTRVRVQIGVEEPDWVISIEDDGRGLPAEADKRAAPSTAEASEERGGHGLYNMRYRASLIGARLTWETPEDGHGTRVVLRMGLTAPAAGPAQP
ncbi:MAG: ATP-binding protein [Acetobacteraceae bacterium]|nr:ATP-binding protein [Acetobacteraceae bacterium]